MSKVSSRELTIRYALYQIFFFAATAGTGAFAATYLQSKGFRAAQIGTVLAATNIISCFLQPLLGDLADRLRGFVFPKIIGVMVFGSEICYLIIQLLHPEVLMTGILYVTGGLLVSAIVSISNALCAYYAKRNYNINFGVGAGMGSLSYSFASLGFGYVIAWFGADWMIWLALIFQAVLFFLVLGYPKVEEKELSQGTAEEKTRERVSLAAFWKKYSRFSLTIVGVLLIAMCHSMAENYLINLFQRMGGGSMNVGTALFIACISATPFLLFFDKVQKKVGVSVLMRLSGVLYALKALLLVLAPTIQTVYLIELLQFCTYGFIYPSLYYFTKERIDDADMAKGQAVAMSLHTLGLALGSFAGGRLIDSFGVDRMLLTATGFAAVGAAVINLTIKEPA